MGRDSIQASIERNKRVEAGELTQEEADLIPDLVPCITRLHFEAAMIKARKSVTDEIVKQYEDFAASMKQQWSNTDQEKETLYKATIILTMRPDIDNPDEYCFRCTHFITVFESSLSKSYTIH